MKLKIFGANLKDQSKGQHVVHEANCRDCSKLHALREYCSVEEHSSRVSVASAIYGDQIAEEPDSKPQDYLCEIHFAPCCDSLPTESFKA